MNIQNINIETMVFCLIIFALGIFFHTRNEKKIVENAPTILTTIGIFATFLAIAIGLLKFNASNLQESVPDLLNSMKTAFWASVIGVGMAITFKFKGLFFYHEDDYDEDFTETLIRELKEFRKENKENLDNLIKSQNESLEKLAKSSSDELVKALEEVIKDFNTKINEQFGENFKRLNEAVEKLLVWQDQYKEYIETTTQSLTEITNNLDKGVKDLTIIIEKSSEISENMENFTDNAEKFSTISEELQKTIGNLDSQRNAIQTQLSSLSTLVSNASNDLPNIEHKVLDIAKTMQKSADQFNHTISELSTETQNQTRALTDGIEDALTESLTTLSGQLSAMTEKFAYDYNQLSKALTRISKATQNGGM